MERLLDIAAQRLKIDRVELRRRNLIRHDKLPHRTATGLTYDSGDFAGNIARVLESADWKGFPARAARTQRSAAGCSASASPTMSRPRSACRTSASRSASSAAGSVDLIVGTQSSGQGHETELRASDGRPARRHAGSDQLRGRRHRNARLGRRDPFRSLHAACRFADGGDLAHRDRQGARGSRPPCSTSPEGDISFTDGLFIGAEQQPAPDLVRYCRAPSTILPSLPDDLREPLRRRGDLHRAHPGLSDRRRGVRGRGRSGDRHDRDPPLHLDRRRRAGRSIR